MARLGQLHISIVHIDLRVHVSTRTHSSIRGLLYNEPPWQYVKVVHAGFYYILSKHKKLIKCWFDTGPLSTTLAQHETSIGLTSVFAGT